MIRAKRLFAAALSIAACGCSFRPKPAAETEFASWIGPDAAAIAGLDLDKLRHTPLSQAIPPEWLVAVEPFDQARRAWLSYNGRDLLVIAAGHFSAVPSGAVAVGHNFVGDDLVLAGSPGAIRAARERHAGGQDGGGQLPRMARELTNEPIWAVARGGVNFPLRGNSANLERLLQFTQYASASAAWATGVRLRFTGYCADTQKSQELEESLRAMVTLGRKAVRAADIEAVLDSVRIERQESKVLVSVTADPAALRRLLR
ncbi:MAG TPA: hypothetical protein VKV17_21345 [Bryobacteraceae bacterium]|nr:hypothetical protein [Bryobacteraceae bacterium]